MQEQPTAARPLIQQGGPFDGFEIISAYGDDQALEDGVLLDISGRLDPSSNADVRNARVTRSIFAEFARIARERHVPEEDIDGAALIACQLLYRAIMRKPADADGWRKTEARSDNQSIGQVWLIPNELGGLTLMFPSDY